MENNSIAKLLVNVNPNSIFPDSYGILTIYLISGALASLEFMRPWLYSQLQESQLQESQCDVWCASYRADAPGIHWRKSSTPRNLTADRVLVSNADQDVAVSGITTTELNYLDGATSNVQTQLNGKAGSSHTHSQYLPLSGGTLTGNLTINSGRYLATNSIQAVNSSSTLQLSSQNQLDISTSGSIITLLSNDSISIDAATTTFSGVARPATNNTYDLGASSLKWRNVYATTFSGNATSATKATQDASGNIITSTYLNKTSTGAHTNSCW